ncbi:hypothetical protein PGLA_24590 [Paenibacillus glacialis]|uniref:Uncharacterized protein n=1 Tax=Paenibacillus glacialis TaxID=494026 RepID=A0A168DCR9_9BACL|nr:hypothetical protein PGLA_24590 [Paenibacillus glacialis]
MTHDHFQGGRHTFPIQNAPKEAVFTHHEYPGVTVSIVKWVVHRTEDGAYEKDLVLRNNRTNELYQDDIFHPHREMHHIRKGNISNPNLI